MAKRTKRTREGRVHVIPTVFAHSLKEFRARLDEILPFAREIQVDFMDGRFVPARSVDPSSIPSLKRYGRYFEAHLMIKDPEKVLGTLKRKGFSTVIAHVEAFDAIPHAYSFISKARSLGLRPGLAVSPGTSIRSLDPGLKKAVVLLFLGVHPGKEGQRFIPSVARNIQVFRRLRTGIPAQVDGGIDPRVAAKLARIGVRRFNVGSFIAESDDPKGAFEKLISAIDK